ncbi:Rv3654c family TadE-like protein [Pseudokineococcus sp. 5B2Z-1]|uniref:Rv3654c family TadE-like protein n=1 Tax=Pseudokineococcus sp. 5B2Z-1 TaxID=3132744 RepID=UPI003097CA7D
MTRRVHRGRAEVRRPAPARSWAAGPAPGRRGHGGGRARRGDRGAGSVLVLGLLLVGVVLCTAAAALGQAVVARHRAAAAADLAALAGADVSLGRAVPAGGPCDAAARVAARGGARLVGCTTGGLEVVVVVAVDVPGALGGLGPARASARAGPR